MLKCQRAGGAVLGFTVMLCALGVGWSAETRIEAGMVYDNNLFEAPVDPQSGWISRFYFAYAGDLRKRPRSSVWLRVPGRCQTILDCGAINVRRIRRSVGQPLERNRVHRAWGAG